MMTDLPQPDLAQVRAFCMRRRTLRYQCVPACIILVATLLNGPSHEAQAQFGGGLFVPPAGQNGQFQADEFRRLPRDPLTQASMLKAMQAIDAGEVAAGLQTLQELLDQDSDFFIMEGAQPPHSLFQAVELLIQEHRDAYERLFGPVAAQMLSEAKANQNTLQLEEVIRRYSQTDAGAAALLELARIDHDRGEPSLAARRLEQLAAHPATKERRGVLLTAARILAAGGQIQQARSLLTQHPAEFPDGAVTDALLTEAAANAVRPAADARLYEWRTPYGDVHHTGQATPAPALADDAWHAEMIDNDFDFPALLAAPDVSRHLAEENRNLLNAIEQQVRANTGRIAMPAARPLIVNQLVMTAGPGSVKAFNLQTGRMEWNGIDLDETFDYLAKQSYSAGAAQDPVREEMRELFASVRGWRDLTSTSLSSDGQNLYAISNCQLVGTTSPQRMMQNTQRHSLLPQRTNRLTAYELASDGKKIWSMGASNEDAPLPGLAEDREIFFLGAPLPVEGRLYVLGEERGQIQIFELDPATGGVQWSLGLLNPERDLVLDDVRRLAGLMPAYGDGLLICPTGEGSLTAVDPLKRQVVWTHIYAKSMQPLRNQIMMMRMMRPQSQSASQSRDELLADQRWFDSRIMIAGERVIFTPPDDDTLVCLKTSDGTPAWKNPLSRTQMVYAAAVFEDQLILVGRSEITSLRLADGTPAWKSPVPIPAPSGRGVRMGDQFLQPLVSGEIGIIDLKSGRLMTRLPLESGQIPGNLVADQGRLVMQNATGLTAFQSREAIESLIASRLRVDPADPVGLSERGTWRLQQGELSEGLADLKTATARQAPASATQVLAWSLLEGLRTDFASYRNETKSMEAGLTTAQQRQQFLRTYAQGLQNSGEYVSAFEHYLEILRVLSWPQALNDFDSRWSATDARWVLARLDELLSATDAATQEKLRQKMTQWVQNSTDVALLLRILPVIPMDWVDASTVLRQLARTESMESSLHAREAILRDLHTNPDPAIRIQAAAQLLTLALKTKDAESARELLAEIETQDVPLAGDPARTTFEFAREIRMQAENADLLHTEFSWPEPVREADNVQAQIRTMLTQIPLLGPPSAALRGWTFFLDAGGANVEIFDPQGQRHSRVPTTYGGARYAAEIELGRYVCMHNHLVLVVLLDRFLVLDFLSDPTSPKILVMREFARETENVFSGRGAMLGIPRPGTRSVLLELRSGRMAANVGPLTDSVLCFGSGEDLIAINPITGEELWRRRDVPAGAEILGDENYVILKPAEGAPVQILRAMDGGLVKASEFPEETLNCLDRHYGDWGTGLPMVESRDGKFFFKLFDPIRETSFWAHSAPANTRWAVVSGQKFAFLTPDRKLSIRDGKTGRELFAASVPLDQPVEEFSVLEFPDQWIVVTNSHPRENQRYSGMPLRAYEILMANADGPVVSLDRGDGHVLWSRTVLNQEVLTQGPDAWPLLLFCKFRGPLESLILNRLSGAVIRQMPTHDDGSRSINWTTEAHPRRVQLKFANDRTTLLYGAATDAVRRSSNAPLQQEDADGQNFKNE